MGWRSLRLPVPLGGGSGIHRHLLRNGATERRADLLLRNSPLYRDKWDERRGYLTYVDRTILKAAATAEVRVPSILNPNEDLGAIMEVLANPEIRNEAWTLIFLAVDIACRTAEDDPADGWWRIHPGPLGGACFTVIRGSRARSWSTFGAWKLSVEFSVK